MLNFYINLIIVIILIKISICNEEVKYIIAEFNSRYPSSNEKDYFYEKCINNYLFTKIKLGSEEQNVEMKIDLDLFEVYIVKEDIVDKNLYIPYNINASTTFTNIVRFYRQKGEFEKAFLSKDCLVVNDGKKDIKTDEFYFAYVDDGYKKFAGSIGFNMEKTIIFPEQSMNFIDQLKNNSIISGYSLTIKFTSNYKGQLLIGPNIEEIIPKEIKSYKSKTVYVSSDGIINGKWELEANKVLVGESELFASKKVRFDLKNDFIIGTDEFTEFISKNFFSSLFGTEKCIKEKVPSYNLYLGVKCLKSVNVKDFPDLKFYFTTTDSEKFNLVMDYRDLFEEKGGYKYFKIILTNNEIPTISVNKEWIFGKEFFKMNLITFNKETKYITIYYKEKQKKEVDNESRPINKNVILLWVLFVVLIIMAGVIAFLLFKCIKQGKIIKKRSRLNILEDEIINGDTN